MLAAPVRLSAPSAASKRRSPRAASTMHSADPGTSANAAIAAEVSSADPGWAVVTSNQASATSMAAVAAARTSSMIRNYPGFAQGISGARLAFEAYQQAWFFGTTFLFMRQPDSLSRESGTRRVAGRQHVRLPHP